MPSNHCSLLAVKSSRSLLVVIFYPQAGCDKMAAESDGEIKVPITASQIIDEAVIKSWFALEYFTLKGLTPQPDAPINRTPEGWPPILA